MFFDEFAGPYDPDSDISPMKFDNGLPLWQIGAEGGFLPAPVICSTICSWDQPSVLTFLLTSPMPPSALRSPFSIWARMSLSVVACPVWILIRPAPPPLGKRWSSAWVPATEVDSSTPPSQLVLPVITPLGAVNNARQVSLNEEDSAVLEDVGPKAALLGTVNSDGTRNHLLWMDDMTENPNVGATEVWEFHNFTADALPIHIQLVQFEVG